MRLRISLTNTLVCFCICFALVFKVQGFFEEENYPRYLTAAVGDYIVFDCDIDFPLGYPIPYRLFWKRQENVIFSWYDGHITEADEYVGRITLLDRNTSNSIFYRHDITDTPTKRHFGRASINLTSIRESDAGWYECRIMFPTRTPAYRNNGTWFHLTVSGGNLLAIPPINQTVQEGEEAKLVCVVKDMTLIRMRWLKDGIPRASYQDLSQRSWVEKDGSLVIHPTDMGDVGEYECEASNQVGDVQRAKAYLNVQYKAKVVYAPPEIHLAYGRPAMIDCHYRANPPLTNLRWEKDGFLFDPYNIQGVFYRKNGSLYFSKVDETHAGSYTCTPYNELGTQGPSPPITVIVQRAPIFTRTPHNLYLKKLGESVEIPCEATDGTNGHKPILVWTKKGSILPLGRYSINEGNLTIRDIEEEDRGVYQCSATNKAATVTAETELLVENIPSTAPYNLTAVSSSTSVHLTWLSRRQRNVEFSVWYKKIESTEWRTYQVPSGRALEATITNLEPGTEYEFMVLCKDDNGEGGPFSKSVRVWTKSEEQHESNLFKGPAPIAYPRNVEAKPIDDGLLVTWDPPEFGMELFKTYIVRWNQAMDDYAFGSAETLDQTYLIKNLLDGLEYDIQIIAVSIDDQQAISEKIRVLYPGFKSIKAISTGIIAGLIFLGIIFVGVYFVRKRFMQSSPSLPIKK
ncbi:protein borderless [Anthonomus grandis grandis]|uniref:protein borderless n=1 Tax=Anthonomus grandis grandis TaxID=2921223 RepID=UPI0021650F90|nr:protein borderless [Anthonomus grandis grandis]